MKDESQSCAALASNHQTLHSILDLVEDFSHRRNFEAAAVTAQIAAEFASRNHPGTFASARLERQLTRLARVALPAEPDARGTAASPPGPRRVLHVLSLAHPKGGHTRLAWRWITNDCSRVHSVALTDQGRLPVPPALLEAVAARGGTVLRVDHARLLARAAALRAAARAADHVVLHVHPFDVTPLLAFAPLAHRPRIIGMNHADHLFWAGASLVDRLIHFRASGETLSIERRAVPRERCSVVPIPIDPPARSRSREAAKAQLGLPADAVLCLTMAFSYKFAAVGGATHLTEAVRPVFAELPQARLIAIGPSPTGPWREAHRECGGRIIAIGERRDPRVYLEAADLFLMSMPVASLTAALEAGSYGLPILELADARLAAGVLDSTSPGLDSSAMIRTDNLAEYRDRLRQLLTDAELRTRVGGQVRQTILDQHAGAGWLRQLEQSLARTEALPARVSTSEREPAPAFTPTDLALGRLRRGLLARLGFIIARRSKALPARDRWKLYAARLRWSPAFSMRFFPVEMFLALVSRRQLAQLARTLEATGLFRRIFDR